MNETDFPATLFLDRLGEGQKNHAPIRRLLAAALADLAGLTVRQISVLMKINTETIDRRSGDITHDYGQAKGFKRDGRKLWNALGAWPWAQYADGKLEADWWESETALRALAGWVGFRAAELDRERRRYAGSNASLISMGVPPPDSWVYDGSPPNSELFSEYYDLSQAERRAKFDDRHAADSQS